MNVKHIIRVEDPVPEYPEQLTEFLEISEFYYDTIQGEDITAGTPAAFLRLKNCTLNCSYCDTRKVWLRGGKYSFATLFKMIDSTDLVTKLSRGQHLVLTGGSPLMQQTELVAFFLHFQSRYGFKPYLECENECTIYPGGSFTYMIDCWNNSPKLSNSSIKRDRRYKSHIIEMLAILPNSWFKFVVKSEVDWLEIMEDYISTRLVSRSQIILMPQGATRDKLMWNSTITVKIAVNENVRFCSREQVMLWNKQTGI